MAKGDFRLFYISGEISSPNHVDHQTPAPHQTLAPH